MADDRRVLSSVETSSVQNLVAVLDMLRLGRASTRSQLMRSTGLGRTVVSQLLNRLVEVGLVGDGPAAESTGGRAPRSVRFRSEAGALLAAQLGATSLAAAVTDLALNPLARFEQRFDIADGPQKALDRVTEVFEALIEQSAVPRSSLWGIGVGVPGPVEFSTGRSISPPIMPGWDAYPIRKHLTERLGLPVWVDNDVNVMALGELYSGRARGVGDFVYIKIGTGIGAGIVCDGRIYRGSQGCAGDVGHVAVSEGSDVVCRCGNRGCLEALAGGAALARDGTAAAVSGQSLVLASVLEEGRAVTAEEVVKAAQRGDAVSLDLLLSCGRRVGDLLATVVNFYNPELILIGGGVSNAGNLLLAAIRENVYRRSLPLATRELQIDLSGLGEEAGLRGAAAMVAEELFAPSHIMDWLDQGTPAGLATALVGANGGLRP